MPSHPSFIDQVSITVASGDGGNGIVAWRREKYEPLGGPAGGSGGKGGDVYFQGEPQMSTLLDFRYKQKLQAAAGSRGGPKNKDGKQGDDLVISVPLGTIIKDSNGKIIADLWHEGQRVLVARGGRGGRGNSKLSCPARRAPHFCEPGESGVERKLDLELKLIADIGLIGLPNAGKSTLLSVLTSACPKIAPYPFTTLTPNLGVLKRPGGDAYVVADIPGLVEGASRGVGLGDQFLRHIERTRLLVHLADLNDDNLLANIKTVNKELYLYNKNLATLPQILALNKADLLGQKDRDKKLKAVRQLLKAPEAVPGQSNLIFVVSCATAEGIDKLSAQIIKSTAALACKHGLYQTSEDSQADQRPDHGFSIARKKKTYFVTGNRVSRLVEVTNLRDPESVNHLYQVLKAMGVIEALIKQGAQPGCDVVAGGVSFTFADYW